jgi:hypothetical protein
VAKEVDGVTAASLVNKTADSHSFSFREVYRLAPSCETPIGVSLDRTG